MNIAALRFFTVFGPRGRPDMAPLKFVSKISQGLPIQQFGDGTSSRDYTYVDDVVSGIVIGCVRSSSAGVESPNPRHASRDTLWSSSAGVESSSPRRASRDTLWSSS